MSALRTPFKALIVGCGNIGGRFDEAVDLLANAQRLPLTHAGAYARSTQCTLAACIEPETQRRKAFEAYWSPAMALARWPDAAHAGALDIISICSPTDQHLTDVQEALRWRPRLIWLEKPMASDLSSAQRIASLCDMAGVAIAVNHNRRWDTGIAELAAAVRDARYGALRYVVAEYGKGVRNNGSHMVDLLQQTVGALSVERVLGGQRDHTEHDPTVSALLRGPSGQPVLLQAGHHSDFSMFECRWVFERAEVHMLDGGNRWRTRLAQPSEQFQGYRRLGDPVEADGHYHRTMSRALANICAYLLGEEALACTSQHALAAQRLCESLADSFLSTLSHAK